LGSTPAEQGGAITFKSHCDRCGGERTLTATPAGATVVLPSECLTKEKCELEMVSDYYVRTR
jgi:hypothetical protein